MKKYNSPEVTVELSTLEDVMVLADTFVDVGGLWGDEQTEENTQG